MNGIILLNKRIGITSCNTLCPLKRYFSTSRVGHTGTLDKFASGLLVVLVGKYTKLSNYIISLDKEYISEFEFGIETDTLDPNGRVVNTTNYIPSLEELILGIKSLVGEIYQIPPKFSSVHVKGKRAYKLALSGESFNLKSRKVNIYDIQILNYNVDSRILKLQIKCSKGTYVRSIARDLALSLGSYAYVKSLERIKIGDFRLDNACFCEDFTSNSLMNLESLGLFEKFYVDNSMIKLVKNGVYINVMISVGEFKILKSSNEEILAVVCGIGLNKYKYVIIF
ncbi:MULTISPECIES: tRNA pseudouridine(55) synthase TruB [Borrelia]|uniref:tRNA pseudouridine synthase B n=2 Tax=Borrelia turicatae TaxID=142 RepID=A0A172XC72_BORTU|nr:MULTISPECIES: tRNA pseudouridine(55) synthase TruB [Borrelia]AAX18119.1 tRNA pseudouridine synthase B [Borrelia turicatae 91E135]ANF34251.1 tRNA pseudouridine(55) synthase TruB [Borrelia turicatae]UPA12445.1 tRNA pseudouridine(55) synthase TruB [Borrelia venezuelensis]UPA13618.1 tRNA pseudouridine(55) synthase TruB [Borrelia turicatae 91E135]UPA15100.1 tRNA pseudouridine(55) synthase TruB [Borrelia turicatae]